MGSIGIGFQLTIFGMGLVFLLLAVMALLITLLLKSDSEKTGEAEEAPAAEEREVRVPAGMDPDRLAAIIVAVTTHRAVQRKSAAPEMREYRPGTLPSQWTTVGRGMANTNWQPPRRNQ